PTFGILQVRYIARGPRPARRSQRKAAAAPTPEGAHRGGCASRRVRIEAGAAAWAERDRKAGAQRMVRQERAETTRRQILDAAAIVFAEGGYVQANLGEIVAQADVTKGALYFHFDSKVTLAGEII